MFHLAPAEGVLLEQILDATHELWHEGLSRTAYGRYYAAQLATGWGRSHLRRTALVADGDVHASAKLYGLTAVADRRTIRVAGIGAVFTQPAHRGRGAGRDLLTRVLERAAAEGADLALLFSEIDPAYYARLGFRPVPAVDLRLRIVEDSRRGAPATMVRAGEERDLADIVAMDAARADPYRWHLARDMDLVRFSITKKRLLAGLGAVGARELHFFVAEEGASAVAYVVISAAGGGAPEWTIECCGDRDPSGARLGAILQVLIARDPSAQRPKVSGWLPGGFHPPQVEIVDRTPARDVLMMKALTPAGEPARELLEEDVLYWKGDAF
jgi:predicted N-acetyltransferase YhbS